MGLGNVLIGNADLILHQMHYRLLHNDPKPPIEDQIEKIDDVYALENIFEDVENKTVQLIKSNRYMKKSVDSDQEFAAFIQENNELIKKNLLNMNKIVEKYYNSIPASEAKMFETRLQKLVEDMDK